MAHPPFFWHGGRDGSPHLRKAGWYVRDRDWYRLRPQILAHYELSKQQIRRLNCYTQQRWICKPR